MRLTATLTPQPVARVAVVAPQSHLRRVLVEVADAGEFEPDPPGHVDEGPMGALAARAAAEGTEIRPRVSDQPIDAEAMVAAGRFELVLGEAALERVAAAAQRTERCAVLTGWLPRQHLEGLRTRLASEGGAVAELAAPRGFLPPTVYAEDTAAASLRPLVTTYGTVPHRNLDPTWFAAIAYMFMFGMMFGDVAHGLLLVALGVAAARLRLHRYPWLSAAAPFLIGTGIASVVFGFLYGEAFGPTGLVEPLWIRPLDEPETLLIAGLVAGSCLLAVTFVLATVNRWREGGPAVALYSASGIGGALLFAGAAVVVGGLAGSITWLWRVGVVVATTGAALTFIGLVFHAGRGMSAVMQAVVEMFDTVLRLGSNVVSFARLAAFGITHAVITTVVWDGTTNLWSRNTLLSMTAAVVLFVVGNLVAFALGALVGAVQALRLEYYEMFSRLFVTEGRPFEPWHPSVERSETHP